VPELIMMIINLKKSGEHCLHKREKVLTILNLISTLFSHPI
jgi:hypothetical protein